MKPHSILQYGLDMLFPPSCAVCKRTGYVLCPACQSSIVCFLPPFCAHCGCPQAAPGLCTRCRHWPLRLSGLRAVGPYSEPLRTCIHCLKYTGVTRLAEPLGLLLAQAARFYDLSADIIIPVPLHEERERERGYNHATLLAQVCGGQLGIPVVPDLLVRTRATAAQAHLSMELRRQNVVGAFACHPAYATTSFYQRTIIIIDDVCTTGATLEACAQTLFTTGAGAVWGLVLARPQ